MLDRDETRDTGEAIVHAVVICSVRRPEVLSATVEALSRQTVPADVVVVSVVTDTDLPDHADWGPAVRVVRSPRGSSVQRNVGVRSLVPTSGPGPGLVTFVDDDAELAPDYFARMRAFMAGHPDVALMTGLVAADGSNRGEIPRDRARAVLAAERGTSFVREVRAGYGCNMTVRGDVALAEPFDERLREYAWQEDTDFSVRCGRHGRVVHYHGCVAVHLAVGGGRVDGRTFGFAQVVNPFYLWRKGTKTGRGLLRDWTHSLGANVRHLADRGRADRAGRLRGNLLGLAEVALHGGRPETVARVAARSRASGRAVQPVAQ